MRKLRAFVSSRATVTAAVTSLGPGSRGDVEDALLAEAGWQEEGVLKRKIIYIHFSNHLYRGGYSFCSIMGH